MMVILYALYDTLRDEIVPDSIFVNPYLAATVWACYEQEEPERYEITRGYHDIPDESS